MTKQEFIASVAQRSGLASRDAQKAVDAFLDTITDTLRSGGDVNFTGFGKFSAAAPRRAAGREPAHGRARPDRRDDRAEVLGRQPAEGRGQGRLAPAPTQRSEGRPPEERPSFSRLHTNIRSPSDRGDAASARRGGPARRARRGAARRRSRRGGGAGALRARAPARRAWRARCSTTSSRGDARLAWRGGCVALAGGGRRARAARGRGVLRRRPRDDRALAGPLADLRDRRGARRARSSSPATFQTLVNPRERLPLQIAALTGIDDARAARARRRRSSRRRASSRSPATPCSSRTTRASTCRSSTPRCCASRGRRLAAPVVDTVWLARRAARRPRGARSGSRRSRTSSAPARGRATARCPMRRRPPRSCSRLIGLAQERGARTRRATSSSSRRRGGAASTASARSRSARRRCRASTSSATRTIRCSTSAARATCARGCARTSARSGSGPSVEAALAAVESIEWRVLGSELEAALEELRLLRELRPPANARSTRPDRYVYLGARGDSRRRHAEADAVRAAEEPAPRGARRTRARGRTSSSGRARRCRACGASSRRTPTRCATRTPRGCATASPPSRRSPPSSSGSSGCARPSSACSLPPRSRASGARSSSRPAASRRRGRSPPGAALEIEAGLAEARRAEPSLAPEDADELLVVAQFLRRPPPELRVADLRRARLAAALHKLESVTQVETGTAVFARPAGGGVERRRSQLVLGLDPVLDLLPVELQGDAAGGPAARADAVARFCRGLIDAAAPFCVAVKPQLAFFEALGSHGLRAFEERARTRARRGCS